MKVSVVLGSVAIASLGFAGVADAWDSALACCLINKVRASVGVAPFKYGECTNGVGAVNNERQAAAQRQDHFVKDAIPRFSQLCRASAYIWGEGAASKWSAWTSEAKVVESLRLSPIHFADMTNPVFNVCGSHQLIGRDGLPYTTTEYFGTNDKAFWNSLPDPCQLVGQGGDSPAPQQPPNQPTQPNRSGHSNEPQQPQQPQQPQKQAPETKKPAPEEKKPEQPAPQPAPEPKKPEQPAPETKQPEQPAPEVKQPAVVVPPPAYNPPAPAPQQCCNCCPAPAAYLGSN